MATTGLFPLCPCALARLPPRRLGDVRPSCARRRASASRSVTPISIAAARAFSDGGNTTQTAPASSRPPRTSGTRFGPPAYFVSRARRSSRPRAASARSAHGRPTVSRPPTKPSTSATPLVQDERGFSDRRSPSGGLQWHRLPRARVESCRGFACAGFCANEKPWVGRSRRSFCRAGSSRQTITSTSSFSASRTPYSANYHLASVTTRTTFQQRRLLARDNAHAQLPSWTLRAP